MTNHPWFDSEDETHFIALNDLSTSNLFSFCDKSQLLKFEELNEGRNYDDENCSISSDMEKNILNDIGICEDENDNDLNKAKLSLLNNADSLIIEDVNNISTPLRYRSSGLEIEDLIFKNHNHPHNFSSSSFSNFNMTNINNINNNNNHNNPFAKTYCEGNTNNTNIQQNILTPAVNEEKISINNISDNHTLSLSEFSNHSSYSLSRASINGNNSNYTYIKPNYVNYMKEDNITIMTNNQNNPNNSNNPNNPINPNNSNNPTININNNHSKHSSNSNINTINNNNNFMLKNKYFTGGNFYQANSFCLDQNNYQNIKKIQNNPNNCTYNGYINRN